MLWTLACLFLTNNSPPVATLMTPTMGLFLRGACSSCSCLFCLGLFFGLFLGPSILFFFRSCLRAYYCDLDCNCPFFWTFFLLGLAFGRNSLGVLGIWDPRSFPRDGCILWYHDRGLCGSHNTCSYLFWIRLTLFVEGELLSFPSPWWWGPLSLSILMACFGVCP